MRLIDIAEATNLTLPTWNKHLTTIAATPYKNNWHREDQEAERVEWEQRAKTHGLLRSATKYHAANFNGKRWPELEKALISDWGDHSIMLNYLNNITEEWPEGQQALVGGVNDRYGASENIVSYLLKKGLRAPGLDEFAKHTLSPKTIRKQLSDRLQQLEEELKTEMAEPPKPKASGPVDPTGLDDSDEFHTRHWQLTIKQLQNRIKTVQQTMAMSDTQLVELMIEKRPKTAATREALRLHWVPPNLRDYINKFPASPGHPENRI